MVSVNWRKLFPVMYGENTEAYVVEVYDRTLRNKFATVAVKVGE